MEDFLSDVHLDFTDPVIAGIIEEAKEEKITENMKIFDLRTLAKLKTIAFF